MAILVIERNGGMLLRRLATRDVDRMDMHLSASEAVALAIDILKQLPGVLGDEALDALCCELAAHDDAKII